jgi:C4-dicarboxylate transporter DctM subunit
VFIVNLEIGYLTPPIGLNLFVASTLFKKGIGEVVRSVLPFVGMMLGCLMLVTYVPTLSLGAVALLKGKNPIITFPDKKAKKAEEKKEDKPKAAPAEKKADAPKKPAGAKTLEELMMEDDEDASQDATEESSGDAPKPKTLEELMNESDEDMGE